MARTPRASGVLDASVILAAIYSEPGGNLSEDQLRRSRVSTVNAAEVEAKLIQRLGLDGHQLAGIWSDLSCGLVPFSASTARRAAYLLAAHRHRGLSLGDAACLATAAQLGVCAWTADRLWAELEGLSIEVRLIR